MNDKKKARGRAKVRVTASVMHCKGPTFSEDELATASLSRERVLDRGDGGLSENEYAFGGLLETTLRDLGKEVEAVLGDQFTEINNNAEEERRDVLLSDADRFIAEATDEFERKRRREVVGAFLKHDFSQSP